MQKSITNFFSRAKPVAVNHDTNVPTKRTANDESNDEEEEKIVKAKEEVDNSTENEEVVIKPQKKKRKRIIENSDDEEDVKEEKKVEVAKNRDIDDSECVNGKESPVKRHKKSPASSKEKDMVNKKEKSAASSKENGEQNKKDKSPTSSKKKKEEKTDKSPGNSKNKEEVKKPVWKPAPRKTVGSKPVKHAKSTPKTPQKKIRRDSEEKDSKEKDNKNDKEEDVSETEDKNVKDDDDTSETEDKDDKDEEAKETEDKNENNKMEDLDGSRDSEEEDSKPEPKAEKTEKKPMTTTVKPKVTAAKVIGSDYDPSKNKYHPIDDAFWKHEETVPYLALAKTLQAIENTRGRLKIVEILANFFRSVIVLTPDDLLFSVYMCLNRLAPAYEGVELGVADTYLMKAVAQATGRTFQQIKHDVGIKGDLGLVAESSRTSQKMMFQPANLTLRGVFQKLKEIASFSGQASMSKKIDKIQSLFVACRFSEARFLIRSLAGKLRIGLAEQSVLQALGQACFMTPPNQGYPPEIMNAGSKMATDKFKSSVDTEAVILKTAYCECPSYDKIIPVILREGISELPVHCHITPGIPMKPMLAQPTKGVQEVLTRFDNVRFTCEWKYDGERAQIHLYPDGKVAVFSRNQENNTSKYPDIVARFKNQTKENVESCILDSEAVAWDKEHKSILPFQVLSTRKKKDAKEDEIQVAVCVFAFDLLYLNGESLVKKPLSERRDLLRSHFEVTEGQFVFAQSHDAETIEEVQEVLEEAVKGNCEGLMVKTLDTNATYEIAKRSHKWLKLKKDYLEGVGDTLDVVVIGGYLGKGKRTGTYGGFLLACHDSENEEFQTLCKIGTGFSDEELQQHSTFFKDHTIPSAKSYYSFDSTLCPDHWFDAVQVWEIKCADISISPVHRAAAGIVDPEKGLSLRFPRFLRIRDDKNPEDATSARQVSDMYYNQEQIKNQQTNAKHTLDDEDFY